MLATELAAHEAQCTFKPADLGQYLGLEVPGVLPSPCVACKYSNNGCPEELSSDELAPHEAKCIFKPVPVPKLRGAGPCRTLARKK